MKAKWWTINLEHINVITDLLSHRLGLPEGTFPLGKTYPDLYQVMTVQQFLEYAEQVAEDDGFWEGLQDKILQPAIGEEWGELLKNSLFFGPDFDPKAPWHCSKKALRDRLRLHITLCDANVGPEGNLARFLWHLSWLLRKIRQFFHGRKLSAA